MNSVHDFSTFKRVFEIAWENFSQVKKVPPIFPFFIVLIFQHIIQIFLQFLSNPAHPDTMLFLQ